MLMLAEDSERKKVVILGDTQVGKTCLINALRGLPYKPDLPSTIGTDYFSIDVVDKSTQNKITLDVYDTAGQEKYHSITLNSLREAQIGLVVYDITDKSSFDHVKQWTEKIIEGSGSQCVIYLIGNKSDMQSKRVISTKEGETLANTLNIASFVEVSAKNGINIAELLQYMSNEKTAPRPEKLEIRIEETPESLEEKKKKCC